MAKKDYTKLEKDDLLKVIEKLESRKKYGLIWDEEKTKEQFEKESENALPVLKEVKGKEIKTDPSKPTNILIEGDNYHALSVLNYTHQGKIDVIYIDPPYNTGNKDFKYNDRFVDKEDSYRHSKWLSFMGKRLRLAKGLMKEKGVMFIHIDDNELSRLIMLCEDIFGENNIDVLVWEKLDSNTKGNANAKIINRVKTTHEYVVIAYINKQKTIFGKIFRYPKWQRIYTNPDNDHRGPYKGGIMSFDESKSNKDSENYYSIKTPSGRKITREWFYSKKEYEDLLKDERVYFPSEGDGIPAVKIFQFLEKEYYCNSILIGFGSTSDAKRELREIFGGECPFDTPKPIKLVKEMIRMSMPDNGIVLDFFAGSGTTGHSLLELNSEEKLGSRQFILVTNNEGNIMDDVCYPRIYKAINGYNYQGEKVEKLFDKTISINDLKNAKDLFLEIEEIKDQYKHKYQSFKVVIELGVVKLLGINENKIKITGLNGNLKYYKTAFVKNSISRDDLKMRITRECTEMLCLREGIFDEVKAKPDYHIFEQNGRIMGVYYSMERDSLAQLKKELDKMEGEKILYCFTFDPLGLDKNDFADWQGVSLEPIPQKILDIYEQIYEY